MFLFVGKGEVRKSKKVEKVGKRKKARKKSNNNTTNKHTAWTKSGITRRNNGHNQPLAQHSPERDVVEGALAAGG